MPDLNVRADAVDVEEIMRQIRARVREKRGADYTESELQQLANVKLEKFLDPRGLRSDLLEEFRKTRTPSPAAPNFAFEADTLFETHRGLLRSLRALLRPVLKLFFNPDKITTALHIQSEVNTQAEQRLRRQEGREPLYYEIVHNLTLEMTRLGIEVHNLQMRVESLSSRMDFDERRARSLEGVVQYRPAAPRRPPAGPSPTAAPAGTEGADAPASDSGRPAEAGPGAEPGPNGERRRRRRRRRRRPGQTMADRTQGSWTGRPGDGSADPGAAASSDSSAERDGDDVDDDADGPDASGQ